MAGGTRGHRPELVPSHLSDGCLQRLSGRPAKALQARLEDGFSVSDRSLAEALGMKVNTFRQNIVRARRQMASCLAENGAPLEEVLP